MPVRPHLDLATLRTFVTGFELGSFARAADRVGRSQSTLSNQLRRLELQMGVALVHRAGRGLALTAAGHEFLSYARRLLALNDEAIAAIRASGADEGVSLGIPQDFAGPWLEDVLVQFAQTHPQTRVEVHIEQSGVLIEGAALGKLDLALSWSPGASHTQRIGSLASSWIASASFGPLRIGSNTPVCLVTANAPCAIRDAAITALDEAGLPWRITVASPNLAGVWSAVRAGMGITLRVPLGMPEALHAVSGQAGELPPAPRLPLYLVEGDADSRAVARDLREIVLKAVNPLL